MMDEFDFEIQDAFHWEEQMILPDAPNEDAQPEIPESFQRSLSFVFDGESFDVRPDSGIYPAANGWLEKNKEVADLVAKAADANAKIKETEAKIEALKKEFGQKLAELQAEMKPYETIKWEFTVAKRKAEREAERAAQVLREAIAAERMRASYKENSLEFERITAGLSWREFAMPHQLEGAKMLALAKRGILGDSMGLGKTLTSLIFCDMLQAQRVLVIVPDDVVTNFVKEINHWAPHRAVFMVGKMSKMQRDQIFSLVLPTMQQFIVVTNYSAWRKDKSLLDKFINVRFDTIIMDEAHSIKNTRTAAFKGCAQIVLADNSCPKCGKAIQHVHDNRDRTTNWSSDGERYLPRDFFVCIGDGSPTKNTRDLEVVAYNGTGCGWTELVDAEAGITREYGAKRSIKYCVPMTGTPILNKPNDLFPLLHLVDDEHYESEAAFLQTFCQADPWRPGNYVFRPGGLDSLTKQLAGKYVARNAKSAGVIIPPQEIIVHDIELDKELYEAQYKVIKQLSESSMIILDSGKKLPILYTISLILRKRQANVWAAGIKLADPETGMIVFDAGDEIRESCKLDFLINEPERTESHEWEGMIPDFTGTGDKTNGERVVVFSQFKGPLRELERRCKAAGIDVVRFDGDTPDHIAEQVKTDFDRKVCDQPGYEYKWQVVLANYRKGGVGLNFTGATKTIILDEEWNGGKADQAYNRTHRIGQTRDTQVHIVRLEKTIDTWMANLIASKRDMTEGFETSAAQNSILDAMRNGEMM